jgi:hypothetical protein
MGVSGKPGWHGNYIARTRKTRVVEDREEKLKEPRK